MLGHAQAAPDAVQPALADISSSPPPHALERAFIRHRRIFWIVIALAMLLSFNGQWRIGLDSANYRGLADSLANGRGYTFGAWAPRAVYPGLPFLLAGLQRICGTSAFRAVHLHECHGHRHAVADLCTRAVAVSEMDRRRRHFLRRDEFIVHPARQRIAHRHAVSARL